MAVWLLLFLSVLAWVVARQTAAHLAATALTVVQNERSVLEAGRADLLRRIREAGSRAVLIPRAESLGLRLPVDSEMVMLQVPSRDAN